MKNMVKPSGASPGLTGHLRRAQAEDGDFRAGHARPAFRFAQVGRFLLRQKDYSCGLPLRSLSS
jgi:hypothetical protein